MMLIPSLLSLKEESIRLVKTNLRQLLIKEIRLENNHSNKIKLGWEEQYQTERRFACLLEKMLLRTSLEVKYPVSYITIFQNGH